MGVLMQAFYWNCPGEEGRPGEWWNLVREQLPRLAATGFTALWLPPANKGANLGGPSMGYDPYDYYDLGDIDQKGSIKTWFGSRDELIALVAAAHAQGQQVYADLVLNHNSGGDGLEVNPIDGQSRWTRFNPGSGLFPRNWQCFHPSRYERWDAATFGDMPDLCHRNPAVYTELLRYATWLLEKIGFDGFRYDMVKGYGGWVVRAIQELRGLHGDAAFKPFGVGECFDSDRTIEDWLLETNTWSDNPAAAFDFPLRYRLRDLCSQYGFSLRRLVDGGTLMQDQPAQAVTFVENHDVARSDPIVSDKMLAYSFILTHEGYPCVFWQDYFGHGLARAGAPDGVSTLVRAHEDFAGGQTSVLYVDDDLYVMQRSGSGSQRGLAFVLNNRGSWNGSRVRTQWPATLLVPRAWSGAERPLEKRTDSGGGVDLWAPARGYVVYVPAS
jgi:alpha-amylase